MYKRMIIIPFFFICAYSASFHITKDGPDTAITQVIPLCSDSDTIVVHVPILENLTIYNLTLTIMNSDHDSLISWRGQSTLGTPVPALECINSEIHFKGISFTGFNGAGGSNSCMYNSCGGGATEGHSGGDAVVSRKSHLIFERCRINGGQGGKGGVNGSKGCYACDCYPCGSPRSDGPTGNGLKLFENSTAETLSVEANSCSADTGSSIKPYIGEILGAIFHKGGHKCESYSILPRPTIAICDISGRKHPNPSTGYQGIYFYYDRNGRVVKRIALQK